jgi:DNA-binding NtrC family response regulator
MDHSFILVDDDRDFLDILKGMLLRSGFENVRTEDNPEAAAALFEEGGAFDMALIDMTMPEMDGMALLDIIKANSPKTECLMVTAVNEARIAVDCLNKGAYDYLLKPVQPEDLMLSINRALEKKRLLDILDIEKSRALPRLERPEPFADIITRSRNVMKVLKEAELHAASDVPLLITGESGTGKELLARAIHGASPRRRHPFTPVNMASLNAGLFEAEFFGHTKGAFTGAATERAGYLAHTDKGTLFLDEIADLPLEMQGKLLRVLQDGEYMKLGASRQHKADVRIIAATNQDVDVLLSRETFRKDLYYRIRGGWLHLPPLRERRDDIPLLIDHFLKTYGRQSGASALDETAACILMEYDYPGNIRELAAILQSAVNLARDAPIAREHLPDDFKKRDVAADCENRGRDAEMVPLAEVERRHILKVYAATGENKSRTARILGIGLNTLRRKLKDYEQN